ncbi:MAG: UDP-N-acetylglucosamine 2-epimerase (non-hydrolyzing) [Candidatus Omnitrophica bacterium]|nr:UDP-N-acetylglucosamine 2-epimerase (non-hydrolyzing) [Candidatus Omnitrophota bacterium]
MKLVSVIGARPQFVKVWAVARALHDYVDEVGRADLAHKIVHTGQHFEEAMSGSFFREFKLSEPDYNLGISGGSQASMVGRMVTALEEILLREKPDAVIVYGDTNSTLAGSIAAACLGIDIAHVESGLRSGDPRQPEEINRVTSDRLSRILFCPIEEAAELLRNEGIVDGVHLVGDVMVDSWCSFVEQRDEAFVQGLDMGPEFCLATFHRAENTNDLGRLAGILESLERLVAGGRPVVFPVHPRVRNLLAEGKVPAPAGVKMIEPVGYARILALQNAASLVLTDSGGIQKESYLFKTPCITVRDRTEWTPTLRGGCNRLVGADAEKIVAASEEIRENPPRNWNRELFGDGHAGDRIAGILWQSYSPSTLEVRLQ